MREALSPEEWNQVRTSWPLWARPNQLPPASDWQTWLLLAGRGFGKTRCGAQWVIDQARTPGSRIALVGPTVADVRLVMVEGESGILACSPPDFAPEYEPSKRQVSWPNGSIATTYSADKPRQLRGPQHHKAWADEIAAWRYADSWDQLQLGLRLGENPQCVATTTPRIRQFLREILKDRATAITRGSTYENRANLPARFFDRIVSKYEGTRLGQQELHAQLLEVQAGAVYPDFGRETHAVPWQHQADLRTLLAVDFGVVKPSVLFAQQVDGALTDGARTMPDHTLVIYDEMHPDGTPTHRLIPQIAARLGGTTVLADAPNGQQWHRYVPGDRGVRLAGIYCDPAGDARSQDSGHSSVEMLRFAFGSIVRFETTPSERSVEAGIERVTLALSPAMERPPELYFAERLFDSDERRGIVASLYGYAYPDQAAGRRTPSGPTKDGEYDHAADALRYLVVNAQNARHDGDWRKPTGVRWGR